MNDEEQRKQLAMMIADIIQELLRDSDELAAILEEASEEGYDVLLTIFSGILIRRREEEEDIEKDNSLPLKFELTPSDIEFLQSIGISPPEEKG